MILNVEVGKDFEDENHDTLRYCTGIHLERLKKITRT
jgi:hypothetical protein